MTSKTLLQRLRVHINNAKIYDFKFARAIRKYKGDSFSIELIEECVSKQEAGEKEKYYIDLFNSIKEGYNSHIGGFGGHTGAYDKASKRMLGPLNHFYGKKHKPESLAIMAEKKAIWRNTEKGIEWMENHRKRFLSDNPGKDKSAETKLKMSKNRKGKHCLKNRQCYLITFPDGHQEEIVGLTEFCKAHGLDQANMSSVVSGRALTHKEFKAQKSPGAT